MKCVCCSDGPAETLDADWGLKIQNQMAESGYFCESCVENCYDDYIIKAPINV